MLLLQLLFTSIILTQTSITEHEDEGHDASGVPVANSAVPIGQAPGAGAVAGGNMTGAPAAPTSITNAFTTPTVDPAIQNAPMANPGTATGPENGMPMGRGLPNSGPNSPPAGNGTTTTNNRQPSMAIMSPGGNQPTAQPVQPNNKVPANSAKSNTAKKTDVAESDAFCLLPSIAMAFLSFLVL